MPRAQQGRSAPHRKSALRPPTHLDHRRRPQVSGRVAPRQATVGAGAGQSPEPFLPEICRWYPHLSARPPPPSLLTSASVPHRDCYRHVENAIPPAGVPYPFYDQLQPSIAAHLAGPGVTMIGPEVEIDDERCCSALSFDAGAADLGLRRQLYLPLKSLSAGIMSATSRPADCRGALLRTGGPRRGGNCTPSSQLPRRRSPIAAFGAGLPARLRERWRRGWPVGNAWTDLGRTASGFGADQARPELPRALPPAGRSAAVRCRGLGESHFLEHRGLRCAGGEKQGRRKEKADPPCHDALHFIGDTKASVPCRPGRIKALRGRLVSLMWHSRRLLRSGPRRRGKPFAPSAAASSDPPQAECPECVSSSPQPRGGHANSSVTGTRGG